MEGIVVRSEDEEWLQERAKLVRPEFTQAIADHWSRRKIEWNEVIPPASPGCRIASSRMAHGET